jgi:competence protein ComEA
VQHAVLAAGDFTAQADAGFINLAARLQDGQHIIVPAKPEPTRPFASPWPRQTTPTTAALRPTTAYTPAKGVTKGGAKVNINTANAAELESLPGIGPVLAEAILRYRSAYGPFKRIEDLLDVPGIGEKTLEKLKPFITI